MRMVNNLGTDVGDQPADENSGHGTAGVDDHVPELWGAAAGKILMKLIQHGVGEGDETCRERQFPAADAAGVQGDGECDAEQGIFQEMSQFPDIIFPADYHCRLFGGRPSFVHVIIDAVDKALRDFRTEVRGFNCRLGGKAEDHHGHKNGWQEDQQFQKVLRYFSHKQGKIIHRCLFYHAGPLLAGRILFFHKGFITGFITAAAESEDSRQTG